MSKRTATKSAGPLRFSLCVIARNEAAFIGDCLDSARKFVDEMVVLDTGSTDGTVEIARAHGARVEHFTWVDDFSAARNRAIELATGDWIVMLDADERLVEETGPALRDLPTRIPANVHGVCPVIESRRMDNTGGVNIAGQVPRIFRRDTRIRYVGIVHEDLKFLPDANATRCVAVSDIRIIHYGYDATVYKERSKDARNSALLEKQLERTPNNGRTLFFAAQQNGAMGRHAEAIGYLERALLNADLLTSPFRAESYARLIVHHGALGNHEAAVAVGDQAAAAGLISAPALEALARVEEDRGRRGRAVKLLQQALDPALPSLLTQDEGVGTWGTRLRLAELYERLGEEDSALESLEAAYPVVPESARPTVAIQATQLAVRIRDRVSGLTWLDRAHGVFPDDADAQRQLIDLGVALFELGSLDIEADGPVLVELSVARRDWQTAYDVARSLDPKLAGSVARILLVAKHLRDDGAFEAALDLLNGALDVPQDDARLYFLLSRTLTDLGRFEDAQTALQLVEATLKVPSNQAA